MRLHHFALPLLLLGARQQAADSTAVLRAHVARAIPLHAGESLIPIAVTIESSLRCFGQVCPPVPLPPELVAYIRDTARIRMGPLDSVRVCRATVPISCTVPPSRAVLQLYKPIINGDSAHVMHSWYDPEGSPTMSRRSLSSHGEEDVYARVGTVWRFVRVVNTWTN
jgi:hypothetical protein